MMRSNIRIHNIYMSEDEKDDGRAREMERNYNMSLNIVKKDRWEG